MLSNGVTVEKGAVVKDSVIMSNTVIKSGAVVKYSIIDSDCVISENVIVGEEKETAKGIAVIGSSLCIEPGVRIASDAMINNDSVDGVSVIQK